MDFSTLCQEMKQFSIKKKGDIFEQFTEQYLLYQMDGIDQIYRWSEIPTNLLNIYGLNKKDIGVDILIVMKNGTYQTVQCKYIGNRYKKSTWSEISTFVSTSSLIKTKSGKDTKMIWFTNSYKTDKKLTDLNIKVVDGSILDSINRDVCKIISTNLGIKAKLQGHKYGQKYEQKYEQKYGQGHILIKSPKKDNKVSAIQENEFNEDISLIMVIIEEKSYQTEKCDLFQKYRNLKSSLSSDQVNTMDQIKYWWWTSGEMMWWIKYDNICSKVNFLFNNPSPTLLTNITNWCLSEKDNVRFKSHTQNIIELVQGIV